jgi:MoaA/NifB/PqqE/SkfB family radical SAM enzyme
MWRETTVMRVCPDDSVFIPFLSGSIRGVFPLPAATATTRGRSNWRPSSTTGAIAVRRAGDVRLLWNMSRSRLANRPLFLSHLVTARCNALCVACLWRFAASGDKRAAEAELTTDEIAWLYRRAAEAGICQLVLWGGEPLLREDIKEILCAASSAHLSTILMTNGWLLPDLWPALRGFVRTLMLSLDDVGEDYDRMRGLPGLFARLNSFALGLREDPLRPRLLVNTVLSRLNRGALRRVAPVAKRWGAGLYFCPMEIGEMQSEGFVVRRGDLALSEDELRQAAKLARELKAAGYPLRATNKYLRLLRNDPGLRGFSCRLPHAVLTALPDGSFRDCRRRRTPLGNIRDFLRSDAPLARLFGQPRYREMLREARRCNVCNNPDVIETSWGWQLRPCMIWRSLTLTAS